MSKQFAFKNELGHSYPEWKYEKLGNFAKVITGNTPSPSNKDLWGDSYPWITPADIKGSKNINVSSKGLSPQGWNVARKLPAKSVLITCIGSTIGKMALLISEGSCNQQINAIAPGDTYFTDFLYYFFLWNNKAISNRATKTAVPLLNKSTFEQFIVPLPSLPEQKKIAEFFSALDERIDLQVQKVSLLKEQKKGYQQRVFNRELVFTDDNGNSYPEWEEKKLGEIGQTYSGLNGKTKENFGIGNAKFITYMNVFSNIVANTTALDSVEILEGEKQNLVRKGDILFTISSETAKDVGRASLWNFDTAVYLNSFCFGFRNLSLSVDSLFLVNVLHSEKIRNFISKLGQGSTRFNVSKNRLMEMVVPIPSLSEQKKIAEFFSALDENIDLNERKLELLKEQKKGYLQGIFG